MCRGVVKTFHAGGVVTQALRGIDLDVRGGELMMLVGPSGCGKTTLISVIAGIMNRDSGSCEVFGNDFDAMGSASEPPIAAETSGSCFNNSTSCPLSPRRRMPRSRY